MAILPWTAPKSSPAPDGPITVMASRLELSHLYDVPSFLAAGMRIRQQMLGSPGALGLSLMAKPLRRTFWTLSAWRDPEALGGAVGREPHVQIMKHFRPKMAGSRFVTWTAEDGTLPVSWDEAMRRLENPDTVHDRRTAAA